MNLEEYDKIKNLSYREYCEYLRVKHGCAIYPYMAHGGSKNPKASRTKEGLVCHHIYEDRAIMLCNKFWAMKNPYEWQQPQNLVYCDYLEHLLLHILICEYPSEKRNTGEVVGIGGVINFIVPELNDYFSGCAPKPEWRKNCLELVKNNKDTYMALLKRFKTTCKNYPYYTENCLYKTYTPNGRYCAWKTENNYKLFAEIARL